MASSSYAWLLALACLSCARVASAVVPTNFPFQVVRPSENHTSMVAVPEGLALLGQHHGPIALVSVVGPYHSGKSFLLNTLVRQTQVFSVGSHTSPETMGIWLCRTNMTASDGSEVWLMDSEGFFGPGVDEGYDAKVFALASLLGAHIVYNTVKVIDQQAVGLLEMLVQRAQLFKTRTHNAPVSEVPDFLRSESFPPLTWVVEDFVQDLPESLKQEGATGWLRTYLDASRVGHGATKSGGDGAESLPHEQRKSDLLTRIYKDIRVHTLFLPATGREQLRDLSRLGFDELTQEFRTEVDELRRHVLRSLRARTANGLPMTGTGLAAALTFLVRGLQQGMFQELPSLWNAWKEQVAAVSLNDADAWFASLLQKIDPEDKPLFLSVYNDRLDEAREIATGYYVALVRDFTSYPQVGELRKRIDARVAATVPAYHERVRRFVGERIGGVKAKFGTFLSTFAIPVDPAVLERDGLTWSTKATGNFSNELAAFAATKKAKRAVGMPAFAPEPVTQLTADLRAMLGARSHENERALQQVFKAAVAIVDEALVRELSSNGDALHSKARLKELKKVVEERCWQVFDEQLAGLPWARSVMQYKGNRAVVQTEHIDVRVASFTAVNEKRLTAHFSAAADRAAAAYMANRSTIFMPATEEEIETQHAQIVAAARELLQQAARDLTDTDPFAGAKGHLDTVVVEGYQQTRDKNIELWKVHSDEATRCALGSNRVVHKACGVLCLFTTVPWYHKAVSRRHLNECFGRSSTAQQMAQPLRNRVFEVWYAKDLLKETSRVSTKFTTFVVILLAAIGGLWWRCGRQPPLPPMYYSPHGYPQQQPHPQQFQQQQKPYFFGTGPGGQRVGGGWYGQAPMPGGAGLSQRRTFGFHRAGA